MVLFSIYVKEVKMTIGDDVLLCSWFYVLVNLSFGKFEGSSIVLATES